MSSQLRHRTNRPAGGRSSPPLAGDDDNVEREKVKTIATIDDLTSWSQLGGKLFYSPNVVDLDWRPTLSVVFKLLFSIRIAASFYSVISDCDEVFNYWEPLHLLLFGRGFQTWEYSPLYAIRSWFYIYVHYAPAQLFFALFSGAKVAYFFVLRFLIALLSIAADLSLYESACQRLGNAIGLMYIAFSMFSAGMFGASCAFLPSSFSMTLNTFAMAAYLREQWFLAILCTAISAIVGWPFAAVLGLPVVLEMMFVRWRRLALKFIVYALASAALIVPPLFLVDSYFYGRNVLTPLNIVLYNIFTSHGPELYGVEPVLYYAKNLLLNWNLAVVFAALSLPASLYVFCVGRPNGSTAGWAWYRYMPVLLIFASAFVWLAIFTVQAHKEERFLFPIYPLIALLAAVALEAGRCWMLAHRRCQSIATTVCITSVAFFAAISLSRGYAIHRNYAGAMDIYRAVHDYLLAQQSDMDFAQKQDLIRVCVGKEWYRFPSSFFLPEQLADRYGRKRYVELRFVRSEFRGLLPAHFPQGLLPNVTRQTPMAMNDQNQEEPSRYVGVETCDYLIDLVTGRVADHEPDYTAMTDKFTVIAEKPFLIADRSHPIFRAFYVLFTNDRLYFGRYVVLERR